MMEVIDGPTPGGGIKAEISYFDNSMNAVDKAVASRVMIRELDASGQMVQETWGSLGGGALQNSQGDSIPKYTDDNWDGSQSRFSEEQWQKSCLLPGKIKTDSKLPIREPDGTININAVRNALSRLSQTKGIPDKEALKAKLEGILADFKKGDESPKENALSPAYLQAHYDEVKKRGDVGMIHGAILSDIHRTAKSVAGGKSKAAKAAEVIPEGEPGHELQESPAEEAQEQAEKPDEEADEAKDPSYEYLMAHKKAFDSHKGLGDDIRSEIDATAQKNCMTNSAPEAFRFDSISAEGGIQEDQDTITVPVVLMKEGVVKGALKQYDQFADPKGLQGAKWLEGVPIVREHPASRTVSSATPKLGRIFDVALRPDKRDVFGKAQFFKNALTPDELEKLRSGQPVGGSIGYWCGLEQLRENKEQDGKLYNAIEKGPYFFDHFALTDVPACSTEMGCGFNQNAMAPEDLGKLVKGYTAAEIEKDQSPGPAGKPPDPVVKDDDLGMWDMKPEDMDESQLKGALNSFIKKASSIAIVENPEEQAKQALELIKSIANDDYVVDMKELDEVKSQLNSLVEATKTLTAQIAEKDVKLNSLDSTVANIAAEKKAAEAALSAKQLSDAQEIFFNSLKPAYKTTEEDRAAEWATYTANPAVYMMANSEKLDMTLRTNSKAVPYGREYEDHRQASETDELETFRQNGMLPSIEDIRRGIGLAPQKNDANIVRV
ncbi:MAG TPA: hypothetical protein VN455_01420 [Methanotrichaceae archaeon]|nr:hypothetical protein [Methanotrichaceae archaeon]